MRNIHIVIVCSLLLFFGCTKDTTRSGTTGLEEVTISLALDLDALNSRGFTEMLEDNEETIQELNVLIFHDDLLYGQETFLNIFTHVVFKTKVTDADVSLWVLANSNTSIRAAQLQPGQSKSEIRDLLTASYTEEGMDRDLFPMWGELKVDFPVISTDPLIFQTDPVIHKDVTLLRALARVDVVVGLDLVANPDQKPFKLESIRIFQANNLVQIVPNEDVDPDYPKVTVPSIPVRSVAGVMSVEVESQDKVEAKGLYVPESLDADAMHVENGTFIIVEGKYDNRTTSTYYRLDFKKKGTDQYTPILRNKHYTITIRRVGPGAENFEPVEFEPLEAIVTEWDETEIGGTEDFMTISSREIDLFFYKGATGTVSVSSDLNLYELQFCDENGENPFGLKGPKVESNRFRVEIEDNGKTVRASALINNEDRYPYTEYVLVTSGNIKFVVKITQGTRGMRDYINVFNITGILGNIGDEVLTPGPDTDIMSYMAAGLRMIIKNEQHFGPNGTVPFQGFIISGLQHQTPFVPALLDLFNVVYIPPVNNMGQNALSNDEAVHIVNWVKEKPERVLVVQTDLNSNKNLLDYLGIEAYQMRPTFYTQYEFHPHVPTEILNGPFGNLTGITMQVPGPGNKAYIHIDQHPEITPVLVSTTDEKEMVVGIDLENNIVYVSNYWFYATTGNAGCLTGNGRISNDYDRFIANLWAWIAERVLQDEHDPDITY